MATDFVEIPVFTGHDLRGWIDWLVEFFDQEQFTNDDKMNFAQSFMEGEARVWLLQRKKMMIFESWEELKQSLLLRFGSYKDPERINVVLEQKRRWGELLEFWKIPEATETITESKPQVPYSSLNLEPEVDSLGHRRNLSESDFMSGVGFDVSFEPDNNNLSSAVIIKRVKSPTIVQQSELSCEKASSTTLEKNDLTEATKSHIPNCVLEIKEVESTKYEEHQVAMLKYSSDSVVTHSDVLFKELPYGGAVSEKKNAYQVFARMSAQLKHISSTEKMRKYFKSRRFKFKNKPGIRKVKNSRSIVIKHHMNYSLKRWKYDWSVWHCWRNKTMQKIKLRKIQQHSKPVYECGFMACVIQKIISEANIPVVMLWIRENRNHDSEKMKQLLVCDVTFTVKHRWRSKQFQTVSSLNTKQCYEIEVVSKSGKLQAVAVLGLVSCRCVKGINLRYPMLQLTQSEIIALQGGVAVVYEQLLVALVIQSVSKMLMAWDNVVVIRNTIHLHCFAKLWPATVKFTSCLAWKQLVHYRYIGLTSINPVEQRQCIQGKTRGKPRNMSFTTGWYVTNVDGAHIFVLVKVFFPPHMHKLRNGIMVAAGMSKRQIIQLYQEKRMLLSTGLTFLLWYEFNDDSTMNVEFDILFKGDLLLSQVQNSDTRAQWIGMKNTAYSKGDITLSVGFIIIPKLQKEQLTATFSGFITVFSAAYKSNQSTEAQLHCIFWVLQLVKVLEADHDVHLLPPAASVTKDNIDALKKIVDICYGKASSKLADKLCFCGGGNDMTVVLKSLKKTTRKRGSQHSFTKADMAGEGKDSDHIGGFAVVVIFFKYDQYPLLGFYAYFG